MKFSIRGNKDLEALNGLGLSKEQVMEVGVKKEKSEYTCIMTRDRFFEKNTGRAKCATDELLKEKSSTKKP